MGVYGVQLLINKVFNVSIIKLDFINIFKNALLIREFILNLISTFPEKGRKGNALQLIHRATLKSKENETWAVQEKIAVVYKHEYRFHKI